MGVVTHVTKWLLPCISSDYGPLDHAEPVPIPTDLKHHRLPCRVVEGPTRRMVN